LQCTTLQVQEGYNTSTLPFWLDQFKYQEKKNGIEAEQSFSVTIDTNQQKAINKKTG
jgi:hypothetical protein